MAKITEQLYRLSEKLGVTERAQTIEQQLNLMNEKVDADTKGNNITQALEAYVDVKD